MTQTTPVSKIIKATLLRSLSNEAETIELEAGRSIAENLTDIDFTNAIVIVNGALVREQHIVQTGDIVTIRITPSGVVTGIIAAVFTIGAIIAGALIGREVYKMKEAAEKAQKEAERLKKMMGKRDIDNRAFLRGASNTLATGNSQPYIIGRHFFTPYLLSKPFYKLEGTDGEKQYTYTILECGFNKQILQSVSIDDIVIKTFNDTAPQHGVYSIDADIFADDGLIEISQNGDLLKHLPELNYKVVSVQTNDEITRDDDIKKHPESKKHLLYTLDPHAMSVDAAISFPNGLYAYDKEGDKLKTKVTITPQYSLDGGKNWTSFTFNNNGVMTNTFNRLISTKALRYVAHHDFTRADYDALAFNKQKAILLRFCSNGSNNGQIKNDCYCLYYQCVCFDPNVKGELTPCKVVEDRERAFCTTMGIKLKATARNEQKLKKINVISQGIARVWDGAQWSADKRATRNPAAWALEIETSSCHPASRYDDSELDLESFADFYEHCEANQFKFDWVITQNAKKDDILTYILTACGACMYIDLYGRRAVAIDRKQENALAVYNAQNIIKISNRKTFARQTDGLRIKFVNSKDDLFQEDTYLVMREDNGKVRELTYESLIKDVSVTGVTEYEHVVKHARRLMAIEALRPKVTTIEVGNEGIFYTPMSKVLIQDDCLKIGLGNAVISGCDWRGGRLKKIYLNGTVPVPDVDKAYGVIVNCFTRDGGKPIAVKVEAERDGDVSELTVISAVRISDDAVPDVGNVLSFGELDADGGFSRVTTPYIINGIKRGEKGFSLELVNYHEAVYDAGAIPEYHSNLTRRQGTLPPPIPKDYGGITRDELEKALARVDGTKAAQKAAQEAADLIVHGVRYTDTHYIRDVEMSLPDIVKRIDNDARTLSSSIEMSEEQILLKVEDTAQGLRSFIAVTKEQILAEAEDLKRELKGLLAVQAGAVKAMVEGGGAAGQLALSLELPAMIDKKTFNKFVEKCGGEATAKVYARLAGTDYYAIRGDISGKPVKALWDKAVKAGLLASQIDLRATQIHMAAENVVITGGKNNGQTIIEGDHLRTALIEVEKLFAQKITMKNGGSIQSENYDEHKKTGFKISSDGIAEFNNINIYGEATFIGKTVEASGKLRIPILHSMPNSLENGMVWLQ